MDIHVNDIVSFDKLMLFDKYSEEELGQDSQYSDWIRARQGEFHFRHKQSVSFLPPCLDLSEFEPVFYPMGTNPSFREGKVGLGI